MKIFAYQLRQDGARTVAEVVEHIYAKQLRDRVQPGGNGLRLEERAVGRDLIFMDFAKARSGHGPGRMHPERPIQEFDLAAGENFGEDTAAVYHVPSGYLIVQYNHSGPRANAIANYLSLEELMMARQPDDHVEGVGFSLASVLTRDAYDRLGNLGIVKEVDVLISLPGVERADLNAGRSLGQILQSPMPRGTESIAITYHAARGRQSSLGPDGVMGLVQDLRAMAAGVRRARVRGKRADNGESDSIDLLEEMLSKEADIRVARGQRYARPERWQALETAFREWVAAGTLDIRRE